MSQRSWRWAFIASLALNLLLLGVMGSWWWRWDSRSGPSAVAEAIATLPEPERTDLTRLLDTRRAAVKAAWEQMRTVRETVKQAFSADPYDPDRVAAALAAQREAWDGMQATMQSTLLEIMPKLPAEQRRKMLERRSALWRL